MGSLSRSWDLARQSLGVLRQDPKLVVFPVISFLAGVVLAGIVAGIAFGTGLVGGDRGLTAADALLVLLFYFAAYFVTIYFQVALVAAVRLRLAGGTPSLGYGLAEANRRIVAVLTWAAIAAAVGLVLRLVEQIAARNSSALGRIVAGIAIGLAGMAWSLATFFVIPVICYEGVGGWAAVRRSTQIIRRNWGEAVVGQGGISLVMFLLALAVGLVFGILGWVFLSAGGAAGTALGTVFIAAAVIGVLFFMMLSSTLQSIYASALYEYATAGKVGGYFSREDLAGAFRRGRPRDY